MVDPNKDCVIEECVTWCPGTVQPLWEISDDPNGILSSNPFWHGHDPNDTDPNSPTFCAKWHNWTGYGPVTIRAADPFDPNCFVDIPYELECGEFTEFKNTLPDDNGFIHLSVRHCGDVTWQVDVNEADSPNTIDLGPGPNHPDIHRAMLPPCQKTGSVSFLISDALDPNCFLNPEPKIDIKCSSCANGKCGLGNAAVTTGSIDIDIPLGSVSRSRSAGSILVHESAFTENCATPKTLQYYADDPEIVVVRNANGSLKQVGVPSGLANVTTFGSTTVAFSEDYGYRISFYDPNSYDPPSQPGGDFSIHTSALPFAVWSVENIPGQVDSHGNTPRYLKVQKTNGTGALVEKYLYSYGADMDQQHWGLDTFDPNSANAATILAERNLTWSGSSEAINDLRLDPDAGTLVASYNAVRQHPSIYNRWAIQSETIDPTGLNLTTSSSYYDATSTTPRRLKATATSDGSWALYKYDGHGRTSEEISGWLDVGFDPLNDPDPDPNSARDTVYTYSTTDPNDFRPLSITTKILNKVVSLTTYAYSIETSTGNPDRVKTVETRVFDPSSPTAGLVTTTRSWTTTDLRPYRIDYPDGHADIFDYSIGTFTPNTSDPTASTFTATSSGTYERSDIITAYKYGYDGEFQTQTVTTTNTGDSAKLVTRSQSDLGGQLHASVDAVGLVTSYEYANATSTSGRTVATHRPGGVVETTKYFRDGQIKSIDGDGVVKEFHQYSVDTAKITARTNLGSATSQTGRWSSTISDALGRAVWNLCSAPSGSGAGSVGTYSTYKDSGTPTSGQLVSTQLCKDGDSSSPLSAKTLYEYDELGSLKRSGLKLDSGTSLSLQSNDRIIDTDTGLVGLSEASGGSTVTNYWWRTLRTAYEDPSTSTGTVISQQQSRLTGFAANVTGQTQSIDQIGNKITTTTSFVDTTSGQVTRVTQYPAGAYSDTQLTQNGLLLSTTNPAQITTTLDYDGLGRRTKVHVPTHAPRAYPSSMA